MLALALMLPSLAPATAAGGAPTSDTTRPRIGLALGGGSARGLAHVGVLEWLDEHRIPIDVIAGTSMGGLVAGIYATGEEVADIRALLGATDWDRVLLADSPFDVKTFRRKQDRRSFPALFQLGFKGSWLPIGLNPGQQIALLLDRIAWRYSDMASFDALPTPYRTVAFDLRRSETCVLDSGALGVAMRATMAIPGVFSPVSIDGRELIDGGVLDNVPAEVVRRDLHAEVVIAVNVGVDPAHDPQPSFASVLNRTIDSVMAAGTRRNLAHATVVITPALAGLSSVDWHQTEAWRRRGYAAAAAQAAALLPYALSPADYADHLAARRARRRTDPVVPRAVVVEGVDGVERHTITGELGHHVGVPFDPQRVETDILQLSGTDRYEYLTYRLTTGAERPTLVVRVRPKPNGPPFLAFGIEVDTFDAPRLSTSVAARVTMPDAAGRGSELRVDAVGGTRLGAGAELLRPLWDTRWFVSPHLSAARTLRNRFVDGRLVGEYDATSAGGGVDVGVLLGRQFEGRVGISAARVTERVRVGDPNLPEVAGRECLVTAQAVFDSQDSPVMPSRGVYARSWARRVLDAPATTPGAEGATSDAPDRFWQAWGSVSWFHRAFRRDRVFLRAEAGTSFEAAPAFHLFSLGGPFRMGAFSQDELRGSRMAMVGAGFVRDLESLRTAMGGHVFVAGWVEAGSAWMPRADAVWHTNASAGVILDSVIGPVFVGGSLGAGGHRRLYVSLGPLFR